MPVQLDHTIVHARDSRASAAFLAEILGLPAPARSSPFEVVKTDNGVSLDYIDDAGEIVRQHYAFLVDETEFDAILGRIEARRLPYWADPARTRPGRIYHNEDGRGVYFPDPDGHLLEILTRPSDRAG